MIHTSEVTVRYGETDKMGIVYHPNYFIYFEIGRTLYMKEMGAAYDSIEEMGTYLVVVDAGCRYRSRAQYGQTLLIQTSVTAMSHSKVTFQYTITSSDSKIVIVEGFTVLASVNKDMKVVRLPEQLTLTLKHCIIDTE